MPKLTTNQRREFIEACGWSQRQISRAVGVDERTVRRWFASGGQAPPEFDEWLAKAHAALAPFPPPDLRRAGQPALNE